jgi:tRNA1(Val) A37 N6-methylase TrmN6
MLFYQPESGYCYNSDSLFLYNFISSFKPRGKMLDVGSGCGIIGLLCARDNENIELEAVEKQKIFVEFSQINARVNKINYNLYECDFLDLSEDEKYDYIVSNPPFYPDGVTKSENEILKNARYNSNLPLKYFFKKVSQLLNPHSHFIFCYDPSQFGEICNELANVKMKIVDVQFVHSKIDRVASLVMIHARNGSKSLMKVWEPFISFEGNNISQKAQLIYKKAKTQSIKCQL